MIGLVTSRRPQVVVSGLIAVALLALSLLTFGASAHGIGKAPKTLEELVKGTEMPYKDLGEGKGFVVVVTSKGESTNVLVRPASLGDSDGLKLVEVMALVDKGDKEKKVAPATMQKLLAFNFDTDMGRIGVDNENSVIYQSNLYMNSATSENLVVDLLLAHINRQKVSKIIKAANEEG